MTRAFDPSPPLRQDCDEILSPSTGAGCPGALRDRRIEQGDPSCDGCHCGRSRRAMRWLGHGGGCQAYRLALGDIAGKPEAASTPQSVDQHRRQPDECRFDGFAALRAELQSCRRAGVSPREPGQPPIRRDTAQCPSSCHRQAANRICPSAPHSKKPRGHYTARLLNTTADCAVPPLFHQSTKAEMVASKRNNIERDGSSGRSRGGGMAMRDTGR